MVDLKKHDSWIIESLSATLPLCHFTLQNVKFSQYITGVTRMMESFRNMI